MTENDLKRQWQDGDNDQRMADYKELLSTPGGRRVVMHLITMTGVYRTTQANTETGLAYEAARRDVGLSVISLCNRADAEGVIVAMRERNALMDARETERQILNQKQKQTNQERKL